MKASFWIAAGREAGGGHAARADALAEALWERGFESILYVDDPEAAEAITSGRATVVPLGASSFPAVCETARPDLAVIDLPHQSPASPDDLRRIAASGAVRVAFDSSDPTGQECELLVNAFSTPAAAPGTGPQLLQGLEYVVLRRGFARAQERREWREPPLRCLVAFGASDAAGLTPAAIAALEPLGDRATADVLVGPLVSPSASREIRERAEPLGGRVHTGVRDPLELMLAADIAITSIGSLFFEAAATGLPAILWNVSPAHAELAEQLSRLAPEPIAVNLGAADAGERTRLTDAVARLVDDGDERAGLSRAAAAAIDGRGADRVADVASDLVGASRA